MNVQAQLSEPGAAGGPIPFPPRGAFLGSLSRSGYVEQEWFLDGAAADREYRTRILLRRPADPRTFSGVIVVEPQHLHAFAPIWMACSRYLMRSGHAWAEVAAQKTALDRFVRPFDPQRYARLHIEGPDDVPELYPPYTDRRRLAAFWTGVDRHNHARAEILEQAGAAFRRPGGPFVDAAVRTVVLAGHSQTGGVVTDLVRRPRPARAAPVFDGYFPSGWPAAPLTGCCEPVVQVLSEGDVADPGFAFRPGAEGRRYRRLDADAEGDRFRLYELAGVGHMGTRHPPYDDPARWRAQLPATAVTAGLRMNSLPHGELFQVGLHHLVRWVTADVAPPRAHRLELASDGFVASDEHGNSLGGVRCAELDVPVATHHANVPDSRGRPTHATVGSDRPFDDARLARLHPRAGDRATLLRDRRADLVEQGWFLPEDSPGHRGRPLSQDESDLRLR